MDDGAHAFSCSQSPAKKTGEKQDTGETGRTPRTGAATTRGGKVDVLEGEKQRKEVAELRRQDHEDSEAPVPAEGRTGGGAGGRVGSGIPNTLARSTQPQGCPSL